MTASRLLCFVESANWAEIYFPIRVFAGYTSSFDIKPGNDLAVETKSVDAAMERKGQPSRWKDNPAMYAFAVYLHKNMEKLGIEGIFATEYSIRIKKADAFSWLSIFGAVVQGYKQHCWNGEALWRCAGPHSARRLITQMVSFGKSVPWHVYIRSLVNFK